MQYQKHERDEAAASNPAASSPCLQWDDTYVRKHWSGRLKLLEIIATLLSAASLPMDDTRTRVTFLRAVAWVAFTVAVLDFFLHLTKLWQRIHEIFTAAEAQMTFAALTGFLFVLASALLADLAPSSRHTGSMTLSFVAGFFAAAFYVVEALLHFLIFRQTDPKFPANTEFSTVVF